MKQGFEKRFSNGDIVYWCHSGGNGKYEVHYGMVDEQFSDAIVIDYIVPRERRWINGIPIDEFESGQRYKKLPKGWTYDTQLYEITYSPLTQEEIDFKIDISKPDTLKEAYDKGYLVKDSTIYHGVIEDEVTKDGYRIVKKYPMWMHHIDHVSIMPNRVYFTYKEAFNEVEEKRKEIERQANLTDLEWSIEKIDKSLDLWKGLSGALDNEVEQYRDWLLSMKNVEDIETRVFGGNLQWKYWKNKRWNYIEL